VHKLQVRDTLKISNNLAELIKANSTLKKLELQGNLFGDSEGTLALAKALLENRTLGTLVRHSLLQVILEIL
jgi:hypothetical protein